MKAFFKTIFIITMLAGCSAGTHNSAEKPLVVFVTGDHEYSSEETMPRLAAELEKNYGMRTIVLKSIPDRNAEENIPGLEARDQADVAVFFLRWRRLPPDHLKHIDAYPNAGKPVMGFRTSTPAFNFPEGHESRSWNAFGERAFGAPPGWGGAAKHTHYGHESTTDVYVIEKEKSHPILTGVVPNFKVRSWLYKVLPDYPAKGATWLLMGKAVNPNTAEAIENPVAWTWKSASGARTFMTTMGHPEDFHEEAMQRLCVNAIHWALEKPVPDWKGKFDINVPYKGMD